MLVTLAETQQLLRYIIKTHIKEYFEIVTNIVYMKKMFVLEE